jgi:RNA polymerase sigma-70 factor (ECF subfamily)
VSSPPQERALPLPVVWARTRPRVVAEPEIQDSRCPNDEELMGRLQANDATALDLLFDRYSRLVLGIALRVLHDYGEAEDVVQEVFFHVFQKASLFDPLKGYAKGWIVQVAFHRALDKRAHLGRRGFYLGTEIESLDDTLLGETDLDREIGAKLNRAQLERAFEELPEIQRRTLELFYFEGLELREISEKLNEPLANVRHHYYRGLAKLRKSAFVKKLREK